MFFDKSREIKNILNYQEGENCKFSPSNKNSACCLRQRRWGVEGQKRFCKTVFVPQTPSVKAEINLCFMRSVKEPNLINQ
ncbi:MAG: hypothetical protein ACI9LN_002577 [Saprospiraceae bacterium]|jgi:hypothetical protein